MAWASIDSRTDPPQLAIGAARAEADLCLQIPGMTASKDDGIWRAPLSWPGYVSYKAVWSVQPITEMEPLATWARAKQDEISQRYAMRDALDAPAELATQLVMMEDGGELHLDAVQRGHTAWLSHWRRAIMGDKVGNGKTPPLIRALQITPGALPALVVCPDASPLAWQRKLAQWAPDLRTAVVAGTAAARAKALASGADVYIMVWENVRYHTRLASYPGQAMKRCAKHGGQDSKITAARCEVHDKELNAIRFGTVIPDECHRMANPRSAMSRAVQWLCHHAENCWPVSGTITPSDVGDLWPVLHALDPLAWPVRSRYLDLWARKDWTWGRGAPGILGLRADTAPYFYLAVQPYFRMIDPQIARAGQPLRLPPEFRYPPMSPAQRTAYKQLRKELLADLDGRDLVPGNTAVRFGRAVQLASSMVEISDGEDRAGFTEPVTHLRLPSSKADDVVQFLADNPGQWVIADFSTELLALAARKLDEANITWVGVTGGMSHEAKDGAAQQFQAGRARVCLISPAGREAIDLYAAEGIYFMRPPPSFVMREQMIGRVDRRGQTRRPRVIYAISDGTVDERLYELSEDKEERHNEITTNPELLRWVLGPGDGAVVS
jgi:SNF2-related domain/Helicase conserved C-terminal domain